MITTQTVPCGCGTCEGTLVVYDHETRTLGVFFARNSPNERFVGPVTPDQLAAAFAKVSADPEQFKGSPWTKQELDKHGRYTGGGACAVG